MNSIFLSYAHDNHRSADKLHKLLPPRLKAAKCGPIEIWRDHLIPFGTDWDGEIQAALAGADIFMPLCSPALAASDYVVNHEIKVAQERGMVIVPVALEEMDFSLLNWQGLEKLQIYHLSLSGLRDGKAFSQCETPKHREAFANGVMAAVCAALARCGVNP